MSVLNIAIIIFIVMELSNVFILYFKPDFKYGNSVKVFNDWEEGKESESGHLFAKYLVRWVANVKLIFILLLLGVVIFGNIETQIFATIAMIASISIYYITLHPLIRKLDKAGKITPKGYSKTLGFTILFFILLFSGALVAHFII